MQPEVRWVVGGVAVVLAVVLSVRYEKPVHLAYVRACRGSGRRAVGVLLGGHAVLVVAAVLGAVLVDLVHGVSDSAARILAAVLLVVVVPLTVPLMPGQVSGAGQSATSRADLRKAGATPAVRDVLGLGGAALWFVVVLPVWMLAGFAVLADLWG